MMIKKWGTSSFSLKMLVTTGFSLLLVVKVFLVAIVYSYVFVQMEF